MLINIGFFHHNRLLRGATYASNRPIFACKTKRLERGFSTFLGEWARMHKGFAIIAKFLAVVSLVGCLSGAAEAAPIVLADSLATPPNAFAGGSVSPPLQQATPFSTTGTPLSFTSALIPLHVSIGGTSAGTGLTVSLFSDALGLPGSSLVTLLPNAPLPPFDGSDNSSVLFLPSTPFLLAANTTYWIVAGSSAGSYPWQLATSPGTGPGFISGRATSADSGATWSNSAITLAIRVTADDGAAPEISRAGLSLALAMTAALLALTLSRRRAV